MRDAGRSGGILERYAAVLEAVAAAPEGLSLSEVVRASGLPRGTVHRLIGALAGAGFLAPRDGRKIYVLGPRLLRLLHAGAPPGAIASLLGPLLEDLAARYQETAFVAKLVGKTVRSVAMVTPASESRSYVQPGRIMPIHAAASAKAIFAFQDERLIERMLRRPRRTFTDRTRVAVAQVRADLKRVRRQGYAVCDGELDPGVLSYACPVHLPQVGVLYSIGMVGLSQRLGRYGADDVVGALRAAAERVSEGLPGALRQPAAPGVAAFAGAEGE